MKSAILGAALLLVAVVAMVTGIVPWSDALAVAERVWPILLFVVAITIVTELAEQAELFRVIAERAALLGRGRTVVLWLLVVAIAATATVFLSLDTTAVLLTPVVVLLARHVGLSPLPFALTTVWLANTASLLLPVSNLTNLLAQHALGGITPLEFAAWTAAPAVVSVVVPTAVLLLIFRRGLTGRYKPEGRRPAADPLLLWLSAAVVVLLIPALVSPLPVWLTASVAAVVLASITLVRRPRALRPGLMPWSLLLLASGLFLVLETAQSMGATAVLARVAGSGHDLLSLLHLAGAGALGANAINNLPAYLALEPVAGDPVRLVALLIGVNVGPLITPWASLATLLWHQRLEALGVTLSWWRYAALGLLVVPLTVTLAVMALWLSVGWEFTTN